jgi:uncharacterized damage-inducible protein DinB
MSTEFQELLKDWGRETEGTIAVMQALPVDQYDFRPDPNGRSIGELAWHLAEIDAYVSFGIANGEFQSGTKPPNIGRPKTIEALASAFRTVHNEAVARLLHLNSADLDRQLPYADGTSWTIRDLLRRRILLHVAHHRGQLVLLCRLAGGVPPGLHGPNREESLARKGANAASR